VEQVVIYQIKVDKKFDKQFDIGGNVYMAAENR